MLVINDSAADDNGKHVACHVPYMYLHFDLSELTLSKTRMAPLVSITLKLVKPNLNTNRNIF